MLFARHGFHGISLDAVADEAGFSKGAVYAHFSSKQDLLASLLEMHSEQQLARIRSVLAQPKPLEERIHQIVAPTFGSTGGVQDWCLLLVELWLLAMRDPGLRPRLVRRYEETRTAVADMIEQEAEKLEVRLALPAREVARSLLALGDGLMLQHLIAPSPRTTRAYRSALHALFQAAVAPSAKEEPS